MGLAGIKQIVGRQDALGDEEQFPLFETDVGPEHFAKRPQAGHIAAGDPFDQLAYLRMFRQGAADQRFFAGCLQARQKDVFFFLEMGFQFVAENGWQVDQQGGSVVASFDAQREAERRMVFAGKLEEGGRALHGADFLCEPAPRATLTMMVRMKSARLAAFKLEPA